VKDKSARAKTQRVLVVKVDRENLRSYTYPIFVPDGLSVEKILEISKKFVNVGDFLIIGEKTFRRVRGGWREATDDDIAELVVSTISP